MSILFKKSSSPKFHSSYNNYLKSAFLSSMSLLAPNSFLWTDLQKPQKHIDLDKFFENKAYQNLFSELQEAKKTDDDIEEDDASTNAPESRTTSNLISLGPVDKVALLVKIEEKPNENNNIILLNEKIKKILATPVDLEMKGRFAKVMECEMELQKQQKKE